MGKSSIKRFFLLKTFASGNIYYVFYKITFDIRANAGKVEVS